jgi:hypothetical protein
LEIRTTPGEFIIRRRDAAVVPNIDDFTFSATGNRGPDLRMHITYAKVSIDQTECFNTSGLKTALRLGSDFYRECLQEGINTIARIASEGVRCLRIERGGQPLIDIAREKSRDEVHLTVEAMPKVPPEVTSEPGEVDIWWEGGLQADWTRGRDMGWYRSPGSRLTVTQLPSINISMMPPITQSLDISV